MHLGNFAPRIISCRRAWLHRGLAGIKFIDVIITYVFFESMYCLSDQSLGMEAYLRSVCTP